MTLTPRKRTRAPVNVLNHVEFPPIIIEGIAFYIRVSTSEQAELGFSIEAQLEELRRRARAEHKVVFKEYVDAGISGKSMGKRPALQDMLQDIESGKIREVWVWRLDRLSRKLADITFLTETFNRHDVIFRSVTEKEFDMSTASGRMTMHMMGSIAEYQRSIIVENVKMGMKQRAREGKWNGGQVLGYDGVEVSSGKQVEIVLKPNSMEAEVVRKIFHLYAEGQGLRSIANQMNREGHRTKPGNFFSSVAIKTIINNPVYIGKIRYNVREDWSEKRRKGINPNPMIEDGIHEPIISMELWDVVQALFQKKSFSPPRTFDGTYPLVGLMRCPQCGATLGAHRVCDTLKDGRKVVRRYYVCTAFRNGGRRVCSSNSVKADDVERYVFDRLAEVVQRPKIVEDVVRKLNKDRTVNVVPLQKEQEAIDKEIAAIDAQRKKYFKLYERDGVDEGLLIERLSEFKEQNERLLERKTDVEQRLMECASDPIPVKQVQQLLGQFHSLLHSSPPETQKTLFQSVIRQIRFGVPKDMRTIELEFNPQVQQHFFELAPSAETAEGAFAVHRQKSPSRYTIII
ncbi:recombinase family protein [Paenibacillus sp. FSL R7-0337]|uniref:recombinase family protein n=1 Tax=Paenibacillus sp. FSL R7-0337 TaxID=1926588 RepID=UPI0009F87164|nr:recombinase family protein [Paenibacillus sp. FSL R7-0337]